MDECSRPVLHIINLSILFFNSLIPGIRSEESLVVNEAAITLLLTPQALPKAIFEGT